MRLLRLISAGLLVAGAGWYILHGKNTSEPVAGKNGKTVAVSTAVAKTGNIDIDLTGLGNITSPNTVAVRTRVDGQLMRLMFNEGQFVKSGDLLAELDSRPFAAQLEQAEGQGMRDQALLKEARINLNRYKTLFAQDSVAKQQVDMQESLVNQYEGAVRNDQGQIDNAKLQIVYSHITSPVTGRVGLRQVDPGNIVHSSDANGIVVVTQLQPITAIFTLPEDDIPLVMKHIQASDKITAQAWDREGKNMLASGVVIAVDNQIDQATGTVKLRAEFPNKDNSLFPSQFVNIKCHVETRNDVVTIPVAAIQHGSQGTFVYLVKPDDTVNVHPVKVYMSAGENVAVEDGISKGDIVVVDGSDNLREGTKIEAHPQEKQPVSGK